MLPHQYPIFIHHQCSLKILQGQPPYRGKHNARLMYTPLVSETELLHQAPLAALAPSDIKPLEVRLRSLECLQMGPTRLRQHPSICQPSKHNQL